MQKRTIMIPFISKNESRILNIPDFLKIGDIIIDIQITLPNKDSACQHLKLYTKQIDLLPFEATIFIHSDSKIIDDMQTNVKFYRFNPTINLSCLFNFENIEFQAREYPMELRIESKTKLNSDENSFVQQKISPILPNNNQNINTQSILDLMSKNGKVSQKDIVTIKRDLQILSTQTQTSPKNTNTNNKENEMFKNSAVNFGQAVQKQNFYNNQQIQPNTINNNGFMQKTTPNSTYINSNGNNTFKSSTGNSNQTFQKQNFYNNQQIQLNTINNNGYMPKTAPNNADINNKRGSAFQNTSVNNEQTLQKQNFFNDQKIQTNTIRNNGYTQNQPVKKIHYNGILNQGATCYLNSVVQTLFHIPYFRNVIFQFKANNDRNGQEKVITSFQSLFYNLEHNNYPCRSNAFTTSLGMSKNDVLIQHDAQEFFINFTDVLTEILKKDEKQKDKISYIFGGKTIQTVKNSSLQLLSSHEENIFELIIGVAESVEASLRNFIKEEIINDYNDDRTQTVQKVTLQTKLLSLPRVLKLLIKRYQYDNNSSMNVKDNSRMSFSEDLDLKPYVYKNAQNCCTKYKLYGVIVHQGTQSGGHYYTYIKPEMKNTWYLFNDSFVNSTTSHEAIENNFGGTGGYFSYMKNYSAYILIYVRVDSINEMFMLGQNNEPRRTIQIPRTVSNHAENEQINELNKMTSDPQCQIWFNVFNERCILENCKKGIPSIFNNDYKITISADLRMNSYELYQKVASQIKLNVNCIRLWALSNDYQQLIKIIHPEEQINQLHSQNLFMEIKNEKERLLFSENAQTYFILLYTQLITQPFVFLETAHYEIPSLKYEAIINDGLQVINKNLSTKIQASNSQIYALNSTNIDRKFVLQLQCLNVNGTMMVLNIGNENVFNPNDAMLEFLEEKIGIKKKLQNIKMNTNEVCQSSSSQIYNYFDFMVSELPKTPDKFFETKNKTALIKVYNFSNIYDIEGIIEVPLQVKRQDLITFIQIAFNVVQFNDKDECILLFSREQNLDVPSSRHIDSLYPLSKGDIDTLYYCIVPNKVATSYTSKTRVVQLSQNGYHVTKTVCYYIPDQDIHPFYQFHLMNEDLFGKGMKTRMFIVNENKEFGQPITDENGISFDNKNVLRIEKVSNDQISNELILVQKAKVGKYNKVEVFGEPFYFAYIQNEPTISFKQRMNRFLGEKGIYKVHKKRSYYHNNYVMNENVLIDKWEKQRVLYLVFD